MTTTSYCVICDAAPGGCKHAAARYLPSPIYERTDGGYRVGDEERARWDYNGWVKSSGSEHWRAQPVAAPIPISLEEATETLSTAGVFLDPKLRGMLEDAYRADARQAAQAALHVARSSGSLTSPGGVLVKRLREIIAWPVDPVDTDRDIPF